MGVLEPSGRWLLSFEDFRTALQKHRSLLSELGSVAQTSPLRDPAQGDFRPAADAAAARHGVKVFVPWALSGVVGEWHFYPAAGDPTRIMDEHWYMTDYHVSRETYHERPMHPLKGVNVGPADYVQGVLEDWIAGALQFNPAKQQYAVLRHTDMMRPFSFEDLKRSRHENARPEPHTVEGEALKNPQIYTSNFLIEIVFKTAPGHVGGVLMEKLRDRGYSLSIGPEGRLAFSVKGATAAAHIESKARVNDGRWHHAIAEVDRQAETLTLHLNGRKETAARGVDAAVSLANDGDLHVGGTPAGRYLNGALDFLRLAHGTLADADTTIEELYAWQFDGPFLRDFAGRGPVDGRRTVGAIEAQ